MSGASEGSLDLAAEVGLAAEAQRWLEQGDTARRWALCTVDWKDGKTRRYAPAVNYITHHGKQMEGTTQLLLGRRAEGISQLEPRWRAAPVGGSVTGGRAEGAGSGGGRCWGVGPGRSPRCSFGSGADGPVLSLAQTVVAPLHRLP